MEKHIADTHNRSIDTREGIEVTRNRISERETGGAIRYDEGKLRYELIPPSALRAIAEVLTFGALKYGDRNWERGMKWGRVYGSLMRHMEAWRDGEETDSESGKPHLWHAITNLVMLIEYERTHRELDDRPIGQDNEQKIQ